MEALNEIIDFLPCQTPQLWIDQAVKNLSVLVIDHANCEKKAASTAMSLMYRYIDQGPLIKQLSKLAREELRHFEQVLEIMRDRQIDYVHVSASRYAQGLRKLARTHEPEKLIDTLIIGAIVEARSCERFACLQQALIGLDDDLGDFYGRLLASEARHFRLYLDFAQKVAKAPIDERVLCFLRAEAALIQEPDVELRFHSGPMQVELT